jgi:hypothetical protein
LQDLLLQEVKKEITAEVIIGVEMKKAKLLSKEVTERVFQSRLGKKSLKVLIQEEKKGLIEKHLPKMQLLEKIQ